MIRACYCGRCTLDVDSADYVVNGRPLCDPDCIKRARNTKLASRDVPVGTSWAFPEHRTMAELMDMERREEAARATA